MTGEQFLRRRADPSLLLTRKLLADARHREGEVRRPRRACDGQLRGDGARPSTLRSRSQPGRLHLADCQEA
jgi:hypothetical protein